MLFPPRSGWREGLRGVELAVACWLDSVVVGEDQIHGQVRSAIKLAGRHSGRGSLVFLDLAMPRNVEPAGVGLPGVVVIGMDTLREYPAAAGADDIAAVRAIWQAELAAYRSRPTPPGPLPWWSRGLSRRRAILRSAATPFRP